MSLPLPIIAHPIAASDRNHFQHQVRLLKEFGPYLDIRGMICPTPSAMNDPMLRPYIDELMSLYAPENMKLIVTNNDLGGGWPAGCNQHFRFVVDVLDNEGWNDAPFIFMEPDLYPCHMGWQRMVFNDYKLAATPFRGMLEKTRLIDIDPKNPKQRTPRYTGEVHLVGAGIYPPNYVRYRTPPTPQGTGLSPMASYRNTNGTMPFDVRCEAQHIPATQSPHWLHKPRTINWRHVEGNTYTCQDRQPDEFGLTYAGPCSLSGVALLHGPKDGSFAEALLGTLAPQAPIPQAQEAPQVQPEPAPAVNPLEHIARMERDEEIEALKQQNALIASQNAALQAQLTEALNSFKELAASPVQPAQASAPASPAPRRGRPPKSSTARRPIARKAVAV